VLDPDVVRRRDLARWRHMRAADLPSLGGPQPPDRRPDLRLALNRIARGLPPGSTLTVGTVVTFDVNGKARY